MCLAVPGKVVAWSCQEGPFAEAWVEFAGVRRRVNMACLPEAKLGDYVLVHAGVAIAGIDETEAQQTRSLLAEIELDTAAKPTAQDAGSESEP